MVYTKIISALLGLEISQLYLFAFVLQKVKSSNGLLLK